LKLGSFDDIETRGVVALGESRSGQWGKRVSG
jgi:hypothetical protein